MDRPRLPLRVLYVSEGHSPHDFRFLNSLRQAGLTAAHVAWTPRRSDGEERPCPAPDLPSSRSLFPGVLGRVNRLRRAVRSFRPDLIHAGPVHGPAFWAAWSGREPLVTMAWGSDLLCEARTFLPRWKARFALRRSRAFVGDCEAVRRAAIELGMMAGRIEIFPWGVDLETFSPGHGAWRPRQGWAESFVILSTRNFEAQYGVEVLLEAFLRALTRNGSLRLILVGSGSQEARLRLRVAAARAEDCVHFAGSVPNLDLPDWYRSADVFVSASHCDGSSVSLLEAMACGLPVIVSDIAANQEWVQPADNGWWFADGDVDGLASVLQEAFLSSQRFSLGERSRTIALERANWDRGFIKLLRAYEVARQE